MTDRKYKFSWDLLGNIELGRPNLGPNTRLEVYRLMQFTFRDVIEQHVGTKKADQIFYEKWTSQTLPFSNVNVLLTFKNNKIRTP